MPPITPILYILEQKYYNKDMAKRTLISTRDLKKSYGKRDSKFDALRGINLDIEEGESVAIVGKSGSGKSTLMHLLALLDRPTSGEIRLKGTNTSKLKAKRLNALRNKQFGFVFQSFFMNSNDTVLNNVILPLKIAGVGYRERRRRALHSRLSASKTKLATKQTIFPVAKNSVFALRAPSSTIQKSSSPMSQPATSILVLAKKFKNYSLVLMKKRALRSLSSRTTKISLPNVSAKSVFPTV